MKRFFKYLNSRLAKIMPLWDFDFEHHTKDMVPLYDLDALEFRNLYYVSKREKTYSRISDPRVILLTDDEYCALIFVMLFDKP